MRLCSPDHHKVAEELITTHLVNEMMQSSNVLMKTTDSFSDATGGGIHNTGGCAEPCSTNHHTETPRTDSRF